MSSISCTMRVGPFKSSGAKKITLHVSARLGRNAQTCTSYVCNFCSAISTHRKWEHSIYSGNLAKTYLIEFPSTSQHPSSLVYNRWRVIIVDKMPWQPFKLLTNISCIFVMLNPCSYTGSLLYWCPKQIKVTWRHTQTVTPCIASFEPTLGHER